MTARVPDEDRIRRSSRPACVKPALRGRGSWRMTVTVTERPSHCQSTYCHPHITSSGSQNISIRAATTAQLNEIYEFRYEVYSNEGVLPQFYADHTTRQITDP